MRKMEGGGRRDSLVALADSINETGRMARANVSLTLIGALYLALTLLSTNDENLLRKALFRDIRKASVRTPHCADGT